ncbi:MAG: ParA family protein [Fidelibacterota bacterium]|nr:MAG: ParA family protein [Candidatus Neomarinimicrobiota bacterium]
MRSIAVFNQKGGSGKTTTTVSLSAAIAEYGRRVLVVDMDPQGTATNWFGIKDAGRGIADIFISVRSLVELVRPTAVMGVNLVPASTWLLGAEKVLSWEVGTVQIFSKTMTSLPHGQWDYLIVDCPPALGILTANALIGVEEVLIPIEAHHLALPSVDRVITSVESLRNHLNPELRITGILACRVDSRTRHSKNIVQELRSRFGDLVFKVEIRENVRLAEAPSQGQPITLYDSQCTGARDYRDLAHEIMAGEGEGHGS